MKRLIKCRIGLNFYIQLIFHLNTNFEEIFEFIDNNEFLIN